MDVADATSNVARTHRDWRRACAKWRNRLLSEPRVFLPIDKQQDHDRSAHPAWYTGGVAYKSASRTRPPAGQAGCTVDVAMSESATRFVTPSTFQALSGRPVYVGFVGRTP